MSNIRWIKVKGQLLEEREKCEKEGLGISYLAGFDRAIKIIEGMF